MAQITSLHCDRCGTPAAAGVRFCADCGHRLAADAGPGAPDPLLARVRAALLNEYDVAREIGRGGMAAVFLAEDLRLPRRVALKVMLPELAYSAVMPQRFVAEARTAAMLDHPNIVPVFHAGEQDGLRYFAMRFIDGCSLEQLPRAEGGLPVGLACHILAEVAAALAYAHGHGVVHRDVKPSNVMIDRRWGRVIVTDFGIARVAAGERLTMTGLAIGTPEYMSPEQYANDNPTGASDQYALGAVAYQLLAGHPPFTGTPAEVLVAHMRDEPPPLRTLRPEVPEDVEALVARMLAKQPDARWPSLTALAARFAEHAAASPGASPAGLRALVPERPADQALPEAPVSPAVGVPRAKPAAVAAASAVAGEAPPATTDDDAAPAAAGASPPTAPLASALDAAPGLRETGYTPRGVAALPPLTLVGDATPADAGEEPEPDDALAAYGETDGAALERHRVWLQTDAGVAPAPQPRRSLLVGVVGLAALALVVVLVARGRGAPDAPAPAPTAVVAERPTAADAGDVAPPPPVPDTTPVVVAIDSAALRAVVIETPQRRRPVVLRQNDTLRLAARLVDGRGSAVALAVPIRWSSSAPTIVEVDANGLVRAVGGEGQAWVSARIDSVQTRVRVRVTPAEVAGVPEPPSARPPVVAAMPTSEEAGRTAESLVAAVNEHRVDELRALFAAGPSAAPSAGELLDALARERDIRVATHAVGAIGGDAARPTVPVHLELSWRRRKIVISRGRDGASADLIATLERADGRWRIAALHLASPFRR